MNFQTIFNRHKLLFSIVFLSMAIGLNFWTSDLIFRYFPNRLPADDLLFRLTPHLSAAQYLTDPLNLISIILLAVYIFRSETRKIPFVLFCFALMELIRGVLIILTPLGSVLGNDINFGITAIKQYGAFPSGHVALALMIYFLIEKRTAPKLKIFSLILAVSEIICQILARGHYSIDIAGGFFISYFAFNEIKKFENKLLL